VEAGKRDEVKIKRGDRQLLKVTGLDGGDGLAALGEYTVRVRGALPGDEVVARLQRVQARRGLASARLLTIQSQTVERVAARCSHVGTCGGCIWQDVPYPEQLRIKQAAVQESLNEAGIPVPLDDPLPAAEPFL
jgi:tRNA/tmRNA/rRNA uracil-C5-methylase (TrmA/RlmC/RlmD family)